MFLLRAIASACLLALVSVSANAQQNILVLSSGNATTDNSVVQAFEAIGHIVTLGPEYFEFDGAGIDIFTVIYLQPNHNWASGDMPGTGQASLIDFVCKGGGLITTEWTSYNIYVRGTFQALGAIVPTEYTSWTTTGEATFTLDTPDPVINDGVPTEFTFPLTSVAGTESNIGPRDGATSFYTTSTFAGGSGVVGWDWGLGRVVSFSTVNGTLQVGDETFRRLLGNLATWAGDASPGGSLPCPADCDGDGVATIFDFLCFQNRFADGDPEADCDCSGELNLFDFLCFQNLFDLGCDG